MPQFRVRYTHPSIPRFKQRSVTFEAESGQAAMDAVAAAGWTPLFATDSSSPPRRTRWRPWVRRPRTSPPSPCRRPSTG